MSKLLQIVYKPRVIQNNCLTGTWSISRTHTLDGLPAVQQRTNDKDERKQRVDLLKDVIRSLDYAQYIAKSKRRRGSRLKDAVKRIDTNKPFLFSSFQRQRCADKVDIIAGGCGLGNQSTLASNEEAEEEAMEGEVEADLMVTEAVPSIQTVGQLETSYSSEEPDAADEKKEIFKTLYKAYGYKRSFNNFVVNKLIQNHSEKSAKELRVKHKAEICHYINDSFQTGQGSRAKAVVGALYLNQLNEKKSEANQTKFKSKRSIQDKSGHRYELDIDIFNCVIDNLAKERKLGDIQKQFKRMANLSILPNIETYTSLLTCCIRIGDIHIINRVLIDVKELGFQPEEVIERCALKGKLGSRLEKALKKHFPDFDPTKHQASQSSLQYCCNLLKHFNGGSFTHSNPSHGVLTKKDLRRRVEKQLELENLKSISVRHITPYKSTKRTKVAQELLSKQREEWRISLREGLHSEIEVLKRRLHGKFDPSILPYLELLHVDKFAELMLEEIELAARPSRWMGTRLGALHRELGDRVFTSIEQQRRKQRGVAKKLKDAYVAYAESFSEETHTENHRQKFEQVLDSQRNAHLLNVNSGLAYPTDIKSKVGKFLYDIMLAYCKIDVDVNKPKQLGQAPRLIPAFYTVFRAAVNEHYEEFTAHPEVFRLHEHASEPTTSFAPSDLPLIAPPLPWCSTKFGIDTHRKAELVRYPPILAKDTVELLDSLPSHKLNPMFDSLNCLSATPWKINTEVLDEQIKLFNKGGDMSLDIPVLSSKLPVPLDVTPDMDNKEKAMIFRERARLRKEAYEMNSLWQTELYRLSICNKYRNDVVYFGNNVDFRGRSYPTSPNFSYIGGDVARGVLKFAKGKPLGTKGLDWLKIHLINLTGLKKRSSNLDRLAFANENLETIIDSAEKPFNGAGWWLESDDPWQTLAACKEIAAALSSGDPESFVSHLPIHQDGSCNGLQHYAALGRDEAGARSVNLFPHDTPADVYSDVVELVEKARQRDAANGLEIAKIIDNFLERKVIKQTIMTTVYGVTAYGARQQIRRQLVDLKGFPDEHVSQAAKYLTDQTMRSLDQMFTSARTIQNWLVLCAHLASLQGNFVQWNTPLDFPVIQHYAKKAKHKKSGLMYSKVNAMKQKNAFPPNFIHSLDAAHMMLTALHCLKAGITFASVHDCFWTHACDVDIMNQICREQFVALHNEPILENLAQELVKCHGLPILETDTEEIIRCKNKVNAVFESVTERGSFKLEDVLRSTYFFS